LAQSGLLRKQAELAEKKAAAVAAVADALEQQKKAREERATRSTFEAAVDSEAWFGRGFLSSDGPPGGQSRMKVCEDCGESMRPHLFVEHLRSACRMRLVFCPNHSLGCPAEVPLCELSEHLQRWCDVERQKDELIERSNNRYRCTHART
jgi:hypothetical protein